MKTAEQPTDRVYAHAHYTVHYRPARRARWGGEARPDYSALVLLGGRLRWHAVRDETAFDDESGDRPARRARDAREGSPSKAVAADDGGVLAAGGALLLNPGASAQAAGERAETLALTLAPAFVLDCAARARLTRPDSHVAFRAPVVERDERLARLARDLADELQSERAGQELVVSALVEQTLVHLLRQHVNVRRAAELELSRAGLVDRRVRRAVELMHAHMGRDLPLEEIAAAAHLSPFHFSRLFKKLTGATPHAYLASLRAARAQTLLAETDLSVIEVGSRVGYASPSHFAKAFRQATGLSPRAFRAALVRR